MTNWQKIREDFPVTKDKAYFASAAMSPIPNQVFDRLVREFKQINESGDIFFEEDIAKYYKLRQKIGNAINTSADNIAFVQNTSTAMSLVAIPMKEKFSDFNIVSMIDEFPSTTVPFEYQGITMKYAEPVDSRYPVESITDLIDDKTSAVLTSYVQYCTGFRQNLEKLGQEVQKRGLLFIVNATQAFPFFSIDVKKMNIDVMTVSLHKWGLAGHCGTVFYTSPKFRERFKTPIAGWLSVEPDEDDII